MRFWHHAASSWQDFEALSRRFAKDEDALPRKFWRKARRVAAGLPFAENLLAAHYCAFDRRTPIHVKTTLIAAIAYFVFPNDLLPDWIPGVGYADDEAVLASALALVSAHVTSDHLAAARRVLDRWRGQPQ